MAVREEIIRLTLDTDKFAKEAVDATNAVKDLTKQQKELEKSGKSNSEQYTKNAAELVKLKQEQQAATKTLNDATKAQTAAKGSNEELRAQLSLQTKAYNSLSEEQRENTEEGKKLQKSVKGISDSLKGNEEAVGDNRRSVGDYKKALEGLDSPISSSISGMQGMTTKALAFIATPLGLVIGALGLAIGALTSYFSDNEEGQNALNKITNIFSATLKVLTDIASDVGKAIFDAFSNPKQTLIDLGNFVKQNLINRFTAFAVILEGIIDLDFKKVADGVLQVGTGIENFTDKAAEGFDTVKNKLNEIGDSIERNIGLANDLSKLQQEANVLEREGLIENAKAQVRISQLKVDAVDKENKTAQERQAALQEAIVLTNEILAREQALAQNRLSQAQAASAQGKDTIDDKKALAQAEADLILLEAANAEKRKALVAQLQGINKEIRAEEEAARLAKQEQEALDNEIRKILEEDFTMKFKEASDNRRKIYDEEMKKRASEDQKSRDARVKGSLDELKSHQDAEAQKTRISKLENQSRLSAVTSAFDVISQATKEGSALQKASAMSSTIISTYQGATGAYASLSAIPIVGPALATAAAAAIIAAGFKNLTNIASAATGGVFQGNYFGRVGGRSHADGGTKYYGEDGNRFEVERGEIIAVVNRRSSSLINSLSDLNQLGGGISFGDSRGSHFADGGIALSAAGSSIQERITSDQNMKAAIANLPNPVVFVEDIRSQVDSQVQVESLTTF